MNRIDILSDRELLEYERIIEEMEKEKCEKNLNFFIKKAWHIIEPAIKFTNNWHIDAICEYLQAVTDGEIKRLLINMPPRNLKSVTATVMYPCWTWVNNPYKRFISASYSDTLSKRHNMDRRNIISSNWYQGKWKDKFALKDDLNTQRKFGNDKEGFMFSTSISGTLTGDGGDIIILDDPHNPKKAESDAERQQALDFFTQTLPSRLNDKKNGAIIVIMQRLHEEDISGHILQNDLGYTHLCLPAIAEEKTIIHFPISNKKVVREVGDILNPKREDKKELEQLKKDMGSYAFSGQYQQSPSPTGGGMFKKWWWKYWKPKGADLPPVRVKNQKGEYELIEAIELPNKFDEEAQSWDMAFKNNKDNDFVAGGVWGRKNADRFMLDLILERMEFTESLDAIRKLTRQYPNTRRKLVEDKANGPAIISMLKKEISGLIPYNPGADSKEARAFAITPIVESGNVYLPHPMIAPWVDDFIDTCAKFPKVAHDDCVDQMAQILNSWAVKKDFRAAWC
ncbi:TPA: phage terminase large subunit [Clostridium botulinum]|nr:phage terminase large subunit [Clostridium botulinum]HDI3019141.1 phage terminase large subunit [Clostridium botulinum]